MADDTTRASPPKEGSNRGSGPEEQVRANITGTLPDLPHRVEGRDDDEGTEDAEPADGDNEMPQPDKSDRDPQE